MKGSYRGFYNRAVAYPELVFGKSLWLQDGECSGGGGVEAERPGRHCCCSWAGLVWGLGQGRGGASHVGSGRQHGRSPAKGADMRQQSDEEEETTDRGLA